MGEYPQWLKETVTLKNPIIPESFLVKTDEKGDALRVHVIDMVPRQIINHDTIRELDVKDGAVLADLKQDILKLAVVERYGKNGNIGIGFVHGFQLEKGAMAYSMSHDHHNIVVVGADDTDMALAVNEVARLKGGLAVAADGRILGSMELPIGGLMSQLPAEDVMTRLDELNEMARSLGCRMDAPFMSLSFVSLPTVPDLGLTDMGLVDVLNHRLLPLKA